MPRFFFHLRNDHILDDEEGVELSSNEAAKERASSFALSMAAASIVESQKLDLRHRIDVTNQAGEVIHTVLFGDVVEVKGGPIPSSG